MNGQLGIGLMPSTFYQLECWMPCGKCVRCQHGLYHHCTNKALRWKDDFHNLVTTEGLNDLLTQYFKGSSYTGAFYVGLKATGAVVAGDTAASHGGWTEITGYAEAVRQTLTLGTASAGSIDNSSSRATFSINAATDVYGAALWTNSTKGGTSGKLYGGGFFAGGTITAATKANPGQITVTAHGLNNGEKVLISGVGGMTELNGNVYTITVVNANNFTIGVDTTGFTTYTSGGLAEKQRHVDNGDSLLVTVTLTAAAA